jgi:hypothetical protein
VRLEVQKAVQMVDDRIERTVLMIFVFYQFTQLTGAGNPQFL